MSAESQLNVDTADKNQLVKPKLEFQTLLQQAGATKDTFTMKEVMFYLGQYIIQKQLYDQKQQHIVHCSQDALGRVLGVDSFSVKEPRVLFAMITKNLVAIKSQDSPASPIEPQSETRADKAAEEAVSGSRSSSPEGRGRRRRRSSGRSIDAGPSHSTEGGLAKDRHSSQSSDSHSTSGRSELTVAASDSESDNFSVEFEVESVDSEDYNEDEASLMSTDDQVYEVTIFEAEDNDSFDEDTEITEADYWRCVKCDDPPPPVPKTCPQSPPTNQQPERLQVQMARRTKEWTSPMGKGLSASPTLQPQTLRSSSLPPSRPLPRSRTLPTPSLLRPPWTPRSSSHLPPTLLVLLLESLIWSAVFLQNGVFPESCLDPCIICQSRPKNGCIVHGNTGHLMSCYVCARKLKNRNKLCPVCRLPIQSVVLTYLS
ncbi:hypothetical protein JOQ06_026066 [Pogonophryne albipinna]|uniref:Uncharacterized protein n=1 Tax=Pogonophryne albipinna TaxID=1090488 RepID=A0AAD6A8W1_9TELE|nr:hypothetical protein JOQ06_026066 [Pogonophryne albipinna]